MRRQPPDNNNPANPLNKIAALDIDKEYLIGKDAGKVRLSMSLNFKRSSDLRGFTEGRDGSNVNVTFGMSIQRASLEMVLTDDRGKHADDKVKIRKVAFVGTLSATSNHTESLSTISQSKLGTAGELKAGAKISPTNADANAGANMKAGASVTSSLKKTRKRKTSKSATNITATHAGAKIHWEITPALALFAPSETPYLVGDVFKSPTTSKAVDACIIERSDKGSIAEIIVTGSVFVGMQDFTIHHIQFTDDNGFEIKSNEIKSNNGLIGDVRDHLFQKVAKERILRQVIRKHLIEQGMSLSGSLVEICRASA